MIGATLYKVEHAYTMEGPGRYFWTIYSIHLSAAGAKAERNRRIAEDAEPHESRNSVKHKWRVMPIEVRP